MNGTSTADDASLSVDSHRGIRKQNSVVDGEIIYALFSLLNQSFTEVFLVQVFSKAITPRHHQSSFFSEASEELFVDTGPFKIVSFLLWPGSVASILVSFLKIFSVRIYP